MKEKFQKEKGMEKEKNMIKKEIQYLKENILMEKDGMEKQKDMIDGMLEKYLKLII